MNQYLKIIKASTPYATKMTYLRNRIFGDVVKNVDKLSLKIVKKLQAEPFYKKDSVVNYYPRHMATFHLMSKLRDYGLFRDEHRDFQDEMRRIRRLKGKVAPQKGKGKQSANRK